MTLDLSPEKTCKCPSRKMSCISTKDWAKAQVAVWRFSYCGRDIRDKRLHPATFPISLASKIISLFTHEGEIVVDPFVGSGTTLVAAQDAARSAVGFDLQRKYISLSKSRLGSPNAWNPSIQHVAICDDCRNAPDYLGKESIKLILTSPPYANMLSIKRGNATRHSKTRNNGQLGVMENYSSDARDLGNDDAKSFETSMRDIFTRLFPLMKPKGQCVINISDLYRDKERHLLHVSTINALTMAGFKFKNTIIWDKTNLLNAIGMFGYPSTFLTMGAFEYILHFEKPLNI